MNTDASASDFPVFGSTGSSAESNWTSPTPSQRVNYSEYITFTCKLCALGRQDLIIRGGVRLAVGTLEVFCQSRCHTLPVPLNSLKKCSELDIPSPNDSLAVPGRLGLITLARHCEVLVVKLTSSDIVLCSVRALAELFLALDTGSKGVLHAVRTSTRSATTVSGGQLGSRGLEEKSR